MKVLIINPRTAVVPVMPGVVLAVWCAWVDGELSPVVGEVWIRDRGYVLCYRVVRGDVPAYLLPRRGSVEP